jgi:very-short-patch-repair endonuclease
MDELYNKNGNLKKNSWKNIDNRIIYAKWLGEKLEYTKPEHWYKISHKDIKNNKGGGLLMTYYKDSPILFVKILVKLIYPDYEWFEWNFNKTPQNYWDKAENHKEFMNCLFKEQKYEKMEDWYNISVDIIRNYNGDGLLHKYNSSHINLLKAVFPEYKWLEWKFGMTSLSFWQDINNRKEYAEWLGKEQKYEKMEDWYNITQNIINDNFGGGLLAIYYQGSSIQFLKDVFPEYKWLEWKFKHTSNCFWQDINNRTKYAESLGKILGYTEPEDWYNISYDIIKNNCGGGLLANYYNDSPIQFLRDLFPEYEWVENKFCKNKTEAKLYTIFKNIYSSLITQFKTEWCKNISYLPFDFCIQEHKIIIELDGRQHFEQVSNWTSPEEQFKNDKYKEKCANDNGYLIIRILQEDVLNDTYDWLKELCDAIERIKNGYEKNIYLCKNREYDNFH